MPSYSFPKLSLPDCEETIAFRAFERVLRNDELLAATVKQWVTWTGDVADLMEPTYSTCPMIRLSPFPDASEWATETQHGGAVRIRTQLCIAGTDVNQIMNFWAAFRSAIFPEDLALRAATLAPLLTAGILRPIISQAAYGVIAEEGTGAPLLVAEGMVRLPMLINT